MMRRLFGVLLLLCWGTVASWAADPVSDSLQKAKADYTAAQAKAKADFIDEMHNRIKKFSKKNSRAADAATLREQVKAFEELNVVPTSPQVADLAVVYQASLKQARDEMQKSYDAQIRELITAISRLNALQREASEFRFTGRLPGEVVACDFEVLSGTWGPNEQLNPGETRRDCTEALRRGIQGGMPFTITSSTIGPNVPNKGMSATMLLRIKQQRFKLQLAPDTRLLINRVKTADADAADSKIKIISAKWGPWGLETHPQAMNVADKVDEQMKSNGLVHVGPRVFGEIIFGQPKMLSLTLQIGDHVLDMKITEWSRLEWPMK